MSERCAECHGTGYRRWSSDFSRRLYCYCDLGREVLRTDFRFEKQLRPPEDTSTLIDQIDQGYFPEEEI